MCDGRFQITTKKINFLLNKSEGNVLEDGLDNKTESKVEDKDRSWLMSSLHQVYSRRSDEQLIIFHFYLMIILR